MAKSIKKQAVPTANAVFMELPPDQITVEKQIRSQIDTEEESFQALKASIEKMGLLEPPLVVKCNGGYRLLSGERRLRACCELGLPTIPCRVLEAVGGEAEVISIQLIENLLRQDLDPIDQANACVAFFQAQQEDITYDEIIDLLITFERDPARLDNTFAEIISAIVNYTGKSCRSISNGLTLLRLSERIQNDLKTGLVSPTIGYVFAANLDCDRVMEFYEAFLQTPLTVKALQNRFKQYRDAANAGQKAQKKPFQRLSASMRSTRVVIQKNAATYAKADIEQLLAEVAELQAFLKETLLTAPERNGAGTTADQPTTAASGASPLRKAGKAKTMSTAKKSDSKKKHALAKKGHGRVRKDRRV